MRSEPIAHLLPELQKAISYNPLTGRMWWPETPDREVGCIHGTHGYRVFGYKGRTLRAHRVAWLLHHKTEPPGTIDHRDLDKANNAIWNLRDGTEVNQVNLPLFKKSRTGVAGVTVRPNCTGYKAQFRGEHLYSGKDFFEAVCARKSAENKYWDENG